MRSVRNDDELRRATELIAAARDASPDAFEAAVVDGNRTVDPRGPRSRSQPPTRRSTSAWSG
jgi:hypothetical protein